MKKALLVLGALAVSTSYALDTCCEECCCGTPFLSIGGGYAWSFKTKIVNGPFWDPSAEGYDDNLNQSEFYLLD